jgi:hypothetical protein
VTNWAQLSPESRPAFPERQMAGGAAEVQCPVCHQWRAAFLLEAVPNAAERGVAWACDNERSSWKRTEAVPTLAAAQADQRQIINAGRDAAISGGAVTPFGTFDTGLDSRGKINGAVTMALLQATAGAAYEVSWTLADDSAVTLTGAQMMQAGGAVALHVDAMHQRSRVLKGRIDAATTVAEVLAVIWTLEDGA